MNEKQVRRLARLTGHILWHLEHAPPGRTTRKVLDEYPNEIEEIKALCRLATTFSTDSLFAGIPEE